MTILERLSSGGIRRLGTPRRGFRYLAPSGVRVRRADRERIEQLRIPPAWVDVSISPSPRSAVQAIGRDAAGRWQYLYHDAHVAERERRKQRRLVRFIEALPRMRRVVGRDLRLPGLPREKVLAGILTILGTLFLRPGSEEYATRNGTYGIATLRRRHVTVRGDLVRFDFNGKSGKRQLRELRDRRTARLIRELLRYPGEVFKYRTDEGGLVDVRARHINAYIQEVMGESFSAKDFRTWAANLLCACALARTATGPDDGRPAKRKQVNAAVREVAEYLGNTPAVCRASYIFDEVIHSYEKGRVIRHACDHPTSALSGGTRGLQRAERALVTLLRARVA